MMRRRWLVVAALMFVAAAALYFSRDWLLPQFGRWLDAGQQTSQPADYVFVLGGEFNTRPLAAAALYKAGWARAVLVSHVSANQTTRDGTLPPYDELTRRLLRARGVPHDAIAAIGDGSGTTYDEACALRDFLATHDAADVIVVTSFFHTRRSAWILRRVLGLKMAQVTVVSAPAASFSAADWWHDECGFQAITNEYFRLLFYLFRYGSAGFWLGGTLLVGAGWFGVRRGRKRPLAIPPRRL